MLLAYRVLKHTLGRTICNIRQVSNTFRETFYMETGIWIPGRLPREEENKKTAEITIKAGKWIGEKTVHTVRRIKDFANRYRGAVDEVWSGKYSSY